MSIIENPTEFVGQCEETGKLRCGLLTPLLDLDDKPFTGSRTGTHIHIKGSRGLEVYYAASTAVIAALEQGAQFWVGNLEGSEEAWIVDLS